MAFLPVVLIFLACFATVLIGGAKVRMKAYSGAGGVAQEALYAMRTVSALGIESSLQQRYTSLLAAASKTAMKIAPVTGFTTGLAFSSFVILQVNCSRPLLAQPAIPTASNNGPPRLHPEAQPRLLLVPSCTT
eukprot:4688465-Prymnesium_polylepis.2